MTSLALSAYPPAERGEGKFPSWRESQLWVTATACLAACPRLAALALRWHEDIDLSHHFRLLRQLTGLTAVSDSGIKPGMLTGHTSLRALCLKAFTLSQGTHPDEFLPPRLTRLHLDVDPDKVPSQLLALSEVRGATLRCGSLLKCGGRAVFCAAAPVARIGPLYSWLGLYQQAAATRTLAYRVDAQSIFGGWLRAVLPAFGRLVRWQWQKLACTVVEPWDCFPKHTFHPV